MSVCIREGPFLHIVPTADRAAVPVTDIPQGVVQALPVTFGVALWVVMELSKRKRATSDRVRRVVRFTTLGVTAATALVAWRFMRVLACLHAQVSVSIVWNILACAAVIMTSLIILFGFADARPRAGVLLSLTLAAGVVVADIGLRDVWVSGTSLAAQHLMPLQNVLVLHALACLFHYSRTQLVVFNAPRKHLSVVSEVDSLARRSDVFPERGGPCSERGRERRG